MPRRAVELLTSPRTREAFDLTKEPEAIRDRYGRTLAVITRDGQSIGGTLVGNGLARWYGGGRRSWC